MDVARYIQENLIEAGAALDAFDSALENSDKTAEFLPVTIPTSPRNSQLVFPRPPRSPESSSLASFSSTLIEDDDSEDLRVLRKLLTRKIDERIDTTIGEIEKVMTWLRIIRDVTRAVHRRTLEI